MLRAISKFSKNVLVPAILVFLFIVMWRGTYNYYMSTVATLQCEYKVKNPRPYVRNYSTVEECLSMSDENFDGVVIGAIWFIYWPVKGIIKVSDIIYESVVTNETG